MSQQPSQESLHDPALRRLPAGIKYLEERTVGPSLRSRFNPRRGSCRGGGHAPVLIFIAHLLPRGGINADVALLLNLIILLGFMGYFEAVLTLPGIAGVILTSVWAWTPMC